MLLVQVIVEWFEWTHRRKAMADRMKDALDVYNKGLLLSGTQKWLEVSTTLRAAKLNMAMDQGNQVANYLSPLIVDLKHVYC